MVHGLVSSQTAQTLNMINMGHNAVDDYVTILAVYKTIHASKIALSATNRK